MLANNRYARHEKGNSTLSTEGNIAIFSLARPLLAEPAAITSVMVAESSTASNLDIFIGYGAMVEVSPATAIVLIIANLAGSYIDPQNTLVFLRITAIILAALSFQCVIDCLQALGTIQISG